MTALATRLTTPTAPTRSTLKKPAKAPHCCGLRTASGKASRARPFHPARQTTWRACCACTARRKRTSGACRKPWPTRPSHHAPPRRAQHQVRADGSFRQKGGHAFGRLAAARVERALEIVESDAFSRAVIQTAPVALCVLRHGSHEVVMQNRLANPALPACTVSLAAHLVVRQSCGTYLPRR